MDHSKFQTVVDIPTYPWQTGYRKKNMFLGSCFAENIGNQMSALKFDTNINPFGILYNPESVANALFFLMREKSFIEDDLIEHDGLWHSFFHHGKFSGPDKKLTLEQINTKTKESAAYLKNIDFLFITFGTAWMYRHTNTGKIVSNCHKIPANQFERFRMDVNEIVNRFSVLLDEFFTLNRKAKIVFTVSPIRHWKDGAVENQRSKAALTLAVEQIINNTGSQRCAYFPAYEIVLDELRDYRFYTEDMIHLTGFTIQHIWQKFKETLVDEISEEISGKVQQIINAANHKPFNKNTQKHLSFLNNSLKKTVELETKYKYLNLTLEKAYFNNQINEIKGIQ